MVPFDATTTVLLFAMLFHAFMLLYVLGMVVFPLLTIAVNGLADLARHAFNMQKFPVDTSSKSGNNLTAGE